MKHRTAPRLLGDVREQRTERRAALIAEATRRSQLALALRLAAVVLQLAILACLGVLLERAP